MSFASDFKSFAFKGNVIDLAVGVVIGAAFGKIVSSLVADIVMPIVSLVLPSGDWRTAGIVLHHAADPKDNVVLKWGDFLGAVLDFLVIALVLFIIVAKVLKAMEKHFEKEKTVAPTTKECQYCLEPIPVKATRCKACTSQLALS
jgi:large conductance mechanosensitive channel